MEVFLKYSTDSFVYTNQLTWSEFDHNFLYKKLIDSCWMLSVQLTNHEETKSDQKISIILGEVDYLINSHQLYVSNGFGSCEQRNW